MKFNRWFVVFGALLIQASLGAIYIYSVFKPALKNHFPDWLATDLALPAQIVLAFFALSMIVSGRIQDKIGPKKTSIIGAIFLFSGMFIAAKAQTLAQFVFGFGILGGIGIGAAYVCPIATCVKWFPDKRGFITGLAVAGFGAGGLAFAPLASWLIANVGIMSALFYLGLIYFAAITIGAQFLRIPAADYCPAGWMAASSAINQKIDFSTKEIIKNRKFWILWITYFIGCTAGLMVIMNLMNIWESKASIKLAQNADLILRNGLTDILAQGAFLVMAVSVFNSLGRIIWGRISDKKGREKTLMAIFALCGLALSLLGSLNNIWSFGVAAAIIGFCFGGFLALYPAITADYFGAKNMGANYGLMFSAYGAGGLLGPWLAPKLIVNDSYANSFILAAILCLAAVFLVLQLKTKPR